jgi:glycosyltransferase involved in cell wall biosynthesis
MSVTVVIPSYKRSEYLSVALESLRRQTALKEIDKIIVSENSDDKGSKRVCDQFTDLPIQYIHQKQQLTAVEHHRWILGQSSSEFIAMLHDDDWWYSTHLEEGLTSLRNNRSAVCYFSNFFFTSNEFLKDLKTHFGNMLSLAVQDYLPFKSGELSFKQVALLCFIYTPFHFSSMIGRSDIIQSAADKCLQDAKPYYADRILYPYISAVGPLLFNPQPLVAVRMHNTNDAKTIAQSERNTTHLEGSLKIKELAIDLNVDVLQLWTTILKGCNQDEKAFFRNVFFTHFDEKAFPELQTLFTVDVKYKKLRKVYYTMKRVLKG